MKSRRNKIKIFLDSKYVVNKYPIGYLSITCLLLKGSRGLYERQLNSVYSKVTCQQGTSNLDIKSLWLCCTSHALQTTKSAPHIEPITYLLPYLVWQHNNIHASSQEERDWVVIIDVLPVAAQNGAPRFVVKELSAAINKPRIATNYFVTAAKCRPPINYNPRAQVNDGSC